MSLNFLKNNGITIYSGSLDQRKISGDVKFAYTAWANQRRRCYVKSNPRYKDNGAKGIGVNYSSREFISWFLFNIPKFKGRNPSVGRIDHSASYSFENIRIESVQDNSMERILRVGTTKPRKRVLILDANTMEPIMIADSIRHASSLTHVWAAHIPKYCTLKIKKSVGGYTFRYYEEK